MAWLIQDIARGLLGLFYPDICLCCSTELIGDEKFVCSHCLYDLPVTYFHQRKDNPVARLFWGRAEIENATANYFFRKENRIRMLIHQMKYHGQKEIGLFLGKEMGKSLSDSSFRAIDIIVPVPLHPKKLRKRGYNQSEWIARGVAEIMNKPVVTETLVRHSTSGSQTQKKRFERWENVHSGFGLADPGIFSGKHILLIDDVLTTGATIEACTQAIRMSEQVKVSVATLAFASM